jgi:hypothetical protein
MFDINELKMHTMNRLLLFFSILTIALWTACQDKMSNPLITFENGVDSIADVFPGDIIHVKGTITAEGPLAGAFYFIQKKDAGVLEENGDRLILGQEGFSGSFSLEVTAEATTSGVKIIAEDKNGNRTVKIFKIIKGIDEINIVLEEPSFLDDINSGEVFHVKGKVTSKTKITNLNYRIIKGDINDSPVDLDITGALELPFDISLTARNGWTGVLITASNKSGLVVEEKFEIKQVTHVGPSVLFDSEEILVKPDSMFTVSGRVASNHPVSSLSYVVVRGTVSDPAKPALLTGDRFRFEANADETATAVMVIATDERGNEGESTIPVSILFPSRIEGNTMIHYKNIILADNLSKGYFSFSLAPYVLDKEKATSNQEHVNLLYSNLFIGEGNANNGPAVFGPNVYNASTIKAPYMVEGWSTLNLTRTPVANDFFSVSGLTFDEIPDNKDAWDQINQYIKSKIGSSSVVRQKNVSVGYMFAIGYGGTTAGEINKYAIVIVRGMGGKNATSVGESTGAWIELEIKMSK